MLGVRMTAISPIDCFISTYESHFTDLLPSPIMRVSHVILPILLGISCLFLTLKLKTKSPFDRIGTVSIIALSILNYFSSVFKLISVSHTFSGKKGVLKDLFFDDHEIFSLFIQKIDLFLKPALDSALNYHRFNSLNIIPAMVAACIVLKNIRKISSHPELFLTTMLFAISLSYCSIMAKADLERLPSLKTLAGKLLQCRTA